MGILGIDMVKGFLALSLFVRALPGMATIYEYNAGQRKIVEIDNVDWDDVAGTLGWTYKQADLGSRVEMAVAGADGFQDPLVGHQFQKYFSRHTVDYLRHLPSDADVYLITSEERELQVSEFFRIIAVWKPLALT